MSVLVSLMCHPEREPAFELPPGPYEVMLNKTPGYGNAVRQAFREARRRGSDLVLADTDGYHPPSEIVWLAKHGGFYTQGIVKPYRAGIGFQSKMFSLGYSLLVMRRVRDATGGFYRVANSLLSKVEPTADDMTVHIEILNKAFLLNTSILQYPYWEGVNDRKNSKRTKNYQWKLLVAALG